jgi:hypothetical protein
MSARPSSGKRGRALALYLLMVIDEDACRLPLLDYVSDSEDFDRSAFSAVLHRLGAHARGR